MKLKPKYSGKLSHKFWDLVNSLPEGGPQESVYFAGVLLQDIEAQVLKALHEELNEIEKEK